MLVTEQYLFSVLDFSRRFYAAAVDLRAFACI